MDLSIIKKCPLFAGVDAAQFDAIFHCLGAAQQTFSKGDFIFRAGSPAHQVGIVLSGGAHVIQEDFWGNRAILTHIAPGGLFGEAFSCAGTEQLPVSVVAAEHAAILLLDYRKLLSSCAASCGFHTQLISNMLQILASKNILLTQKMEHISRRTTREKLLSFLSAQAVQAGSGEVVIPYNRQELADFLCVERSALSRELARMKQEGLLDYEKSRFVLH